VGSIRVAWWNLENLFDTVDDPISRDFDFTPSEGWTATAYKAKKQNLAAALNELHGGLGPELLGVAEVEGDTVFEELIAETGNTQGSVRDERPARDRRVARLRRPQALRRGQALARGASALPDPRHLRSRVQGEGHERGVRCHREPLAFPPARPFGVRAIADRCRREHRLPRARPRPPGLGHLRAVARPEQARPSRSSRRKPQTTGAATPSSTTPPGAFSNPRTLAPSTSPQPQQARSSPTGTKSSTRSSAPADCSNQPGSVST
jgi:hypothetical protein